MDNRIPPIRPDVVGVETAARPTPTPVRVHFSEVLAGGARAMVRGAEAAVRALPGSPLMAVTLRGAATGVPLTAVGRGGAALATSPVPEGPGGVGGGGVGGVGVGVGTGAPSDGGLEGSLQQAQEMNLYYLQIQEEVNAQNRTFTALSNVLKVEHDTAKSAIGNIH